MEWRGRSTFPGSPAKESSPPGRTVHVSPHGSIAWSDDVELCADSIYLELTGKKPEDLFPHVSVAQP